MRKMKKEYVEPGLLVVRMDMENIICTSSGKLDHIGEARPSDENVDAGGLGLQEVRYEKENLEFIFMYGITAHMLTESNGSKSK